MNIKYLTMSTTCETQDVHAQSCLLSSEFLPALQAQKEDKIEKHLTR